MSTLKSLEHRQKMWNSAVFLDEPACTELRKCLSYIAELEQQLETAKELLREIRDGEVNSEDEADKFLRDHQPSELKKVKAELEAARKDAERYRAHIQEAADDAHKNAGAAEFNGEEYQVKYFDKLRDWHLAAIAASKPKDGV